MRQFSGTGIRQMIGANLASFTRPPSTTNPPRENSPMPMPERAPRPSRNASPATSRGRLCRVRKPLATARASCVPEPRPAWAGTTSETLMRCPPRSGSNRSIFCKCCQIRSASGPKTSLALALSIVKRVPKSPIASPMPPKRRPSSPLRSRKPRCNRAGTVTVTAHGCETSSSKSRLPKFVYAPGFSNAKTSLDCVIPSQLAIGTEQSGPTKGPTNKGPPNIGNADGRSQQ